jgi:hypothetical protein
MNISYVSYNTIKGYETSKISRCERNDCVVRTLASAFDITYDRAHKLASKEMKRVVKKGVKTYMFHTFFENFQNKKRQLNKKRVEEVHTKFSYDRYHEWGDKYQTIGTKTVGRFIKENPKGTFVLSVRGHAFCVKDGVVVGGNWEDSKKKRVRVRRAWQIFNGK